LTDHLGCARVPVVNNRIKAMTDRKFHKRRIVVTVASEYELAETLDLNQVNELIVNGDCSGEVEFKPDQVLNGLQAARLLKKQGSDPGFFRLDNKGDDVE
jgi:hypothetical protein